MNKHIIWAVFAVLAFLVNACGGNQPGIETQQTVVTTSPYTEQSSATPTTIPSATPTVTPTPAPAGVGTRIPLPSTPISVSSASRIVGLAKWGKDESIREIAVAADGEVFAVRSDQGVDVYDGNTLERINHFDNADSISQVVPELTEQMDQGRTVSPDGQYYLEQTGPYTVEKEIVPAFCDFPGAQQQPICKPEKVNVSVWHLNLVESSSDIQKQWLELPWGEVNDFAFSPDGKSIAVGWSGMDPTSGLVVLWNLDIDRSRNYVTEGGAMQVRFSPDGKYFASVLQGSKIKFWQVAEVKVEAKEGSYQERRLQELTVADHLGVQRIAFLGTGGNSISISSDNTVKVWSIKNGTSQETLTFGGSPIADFGVSPLDDVAISPNSKYVAAVSSLGYVTIWETGSGSPLSEFLQADMSTGDSYNIVYRHFDLNFTNDNQYLVFLDKGWSESYEYQWSLEKMEVTRDHYVDNYYLDFTEDTTVSVALQNTDEALYILELTDGDTVIYKQSTNFNEVKRIGCLSTDVSKLLLSPDQSLIVTFWRKGEKPCTNEIPPTLSPEGIVHMREWYLSIFDFDGVPLNQKGLATFYLLDQAISPDNALLALTTTKPGPDFSDTYEIGLDILDSASGGLLRRIPLRFVNYDDWKTSPIAFSPDSSLIAVGNSPEEGDIVLIQVSDGQLLRTLKGHTRIVTGLDFSEDGNLLVTSSFDGTIRFWGIP
ncbi:MAG: hypothetical protein FJZ87_02285 [Chloroflexi bacterium]|nr:hypothetical protein [Chloroflexota bacterium]